MNVSASHFEILHLSKVTNCLLYFCPYLVYIIYTNINTSTLVYTLKYIRIEAMNSMECFMICYIQLSAQYTECQQERNLISTLLLNSGQIKGGWLLHFSALELKQTLFPEDSMLWNLPPDICVNSSWKLSCTYRRGLSGKLCIYTVFLLLSHREKKTLQTAPYGSICHTGPLHPCSVVLQVITRTTNISCKMLHCYGGARQPPW